MYSGSIDKSQGSLQDKENFEPDFSSSCWEHIRIDASSDAEQENESEEAHPSNKADRLDTLSTEVDSNADEIKKNLNDELFANLV